MVAVRIIETCTEIVREVLDRVVPETDEVHWEVYMTTLTRYCDEQCEEGHTEPAIGFYLVVRLPETEQEGEQASHASSSWATPVGCAVTDQESFRGAIEESWDAVVFMRQTHALQDLEAEMEALTEENDSGA